MFECDARHDGLLLASEGVLGEVQHVVDGEVLATGGHAVDPRGEMPSADAIQARLTMRDVMETLQASGVETGGPSALTQRDRPLCATHLDHDLPSLVKQKREKD